MARVKIPRVTTGVFLALVLTGAGYLLITLPPVVVDYYRSAQSLGPRWALAYLVSVGLGAALLTGVASWMVVKVLLASRRKHEQGVRRGKDPSQLSRRDQEREMRENLAKGEALAAGGEIPAAEREEIRRRVAALETKFEAGRLEIVAFGTISSGKSSLLNALAGREIFRTDPRGGTTLTRSEIAWSAGDRIILADTPGLAEVQGESRAADAAAQAKDADLVLFVVDGPLKAYESELLEQLGRMEKRVVLCLNKEDWFAGEDRELLLGQLRRQTDGIVAADDVLAVRARAGARTRVRVLADGGEAEETVEQDPDIGRLTERLLAIVGRSGQELLVANLLLQSRGLVDSAKAHARAALDAQADELVNKAMWAAGGAAAVIPLPLLDIAGGSAITVKLVLDLARVYRQEIDADTVVELLGQLTKNLIGMLGVTAAAPAVGAMVGSLLKTVPGIGMIAGGLVQGLVQALLTRWIGKTFILYFQGSMSATPAGLAELARRQWEEVTRPDELRRLVQAGRQALTSQRNETEERTP